MLAFLCVRTKNRKYYIIIRVIIGTAADAVVAVKRNKKTCDNVDVYKNSLARQSFTG